jgi:hypothetical protein
MEQYKSQLEQELINCQKPLSVSSPSFFSVGSYSGLHLNKHEEANFVGPRCLSSYEICNDPAPQILKKASAPLNFTQRVFKT